MTRPGASAGPTGGGHSMANAGGEQGFWCFFGRLIVAAVMGVPAEVSTWAGGFSVAILIFAPLGVDLFTQWENPVIPYVPMLAAFGIFAVAIGRAAHEGQARMTCRASETVQELRDELAEAHAQIEAFGGSCQREDRLRAWERLSAKLRRLISAIGDLPTPHPEAACFYDAWEKEAKEEVTRAFGSQARIEFGKSVLRGERALRSLAFAP